MMVPCAHCPRLFEQTCSNHRYCSPACRYGGYNKSEKGRERDRRCRLANPEKIRESARRYRLANPEKEKERQRRYRLANLEKVKEGERRTKRKVQDYTMIG